MTRRKSSGLWIFVVVGIVLLWGFGFDFQSPFAVAGKGATSAHVSFFLRHGRFGGTGGPGGFLRVAIGRGGGGA